MAANDFTNFIAVHQEDLDAKQFRIGWVCRDQFRPHQPVQSQCLLAGNNRHLTVTLNGALYFNGNLPGDANGARLKIDHSGQKDKVFVIVDKRQPGNWL